MGTTMIDGEAAFILEPRLNVLGEMTPSVDRVLRWLGADKQTIVALTHTGMTDTLEALLCFFSVIAKAAM